MTCLKNTRFKILLFFMTVCMVTMEANSQGFSENFSAGALPIGWNNSYHGVNGAAWSFGNGVAKVVNNAGILGSSVGPSWLITKSIYPEPGFATLVFSARFPTVGPVGNANFSVRITDGISTGYGGYSVLLSVDRNSLSSGGTQQYRVKIPQNFWAKNCFLAFTQEVSGVLSVDTVAIDNLRLESDPLYSRSSGMATDAIWSENPVGSGQTAVFTPNTSLVIQTGHTVNQNFPTRLFNITTDGSGKLSVSCSGVEVGGNITSKGTIDSRGVSVSFSGKYKQFVDGNWFCGNLTMSNLVGVEWLAGTLSMYNRLQVTAGVFYTNGHLLLIEDSSNRGSIGSLVNGVVSGQVYVQKFFPEKQIGWNFIGSPFNATKFSDLNADFYTAGYIGSDNPMATIPTAYSYQEAMSGDINAGLVKVVNESESMLPGRGQYVHCQGNAQGNQAVTLTLKGNINKGEIIIPLNYTNSGQPESDGINLISNPYPSAIDFRKLALQNVQPQYWCYNPVAGVLDAWNKSAKVGLMAANPIVQIGQGIMVAAKPGGGTISFFENSKVDTTVMNSDTTGMYLALALKSSTESYFDVALFNVDTGARVDFDDFDTRHLDFGHPDAPRICFKQNNNELSINSWPSVAAGDSIYFHIRARKTGAYFLNYWKGEGFEDFKVVLVNLSNNERYVMNEQLAVNVQLQVESGNYQWVMIIEPKESFYLKLNNCHGESGGQIVARGPGFGPWNYFWKNGQGVVIRQIIASAGMDTLKELAAGNYSVEIEAGAPYGIVTKNFVLIDPDPVSVNATIVDETCPENNDGKILLEAVGGTGTLKFNWSNQQAGDSLNGLQAGTYTLTVVDDNFCTKVFGPYEIFEPDSLRVTIFAPDTVNVLEENLFKSLTNLPVIGHTWDFGDGSFAYTEEANHAFSFSGTFQMRIEVTNGYCNAYAEKPIAVLTGGDGIAKTTLQNTIQLYENGGKWYLVSQVDNTEFELLNVLGQVLWSKKNVRKSEEVLLPQKFIEGSSYFLQIKIGEKAYRQRIQFY